MSTPPRVEWRYADGGRELMDLIDLGFDAGPRAIELIGRVCWPMARRVEPEAKS